MEIWVTFDYGKLLFLPDPAFVQRGTPVTWRFQSNALTIPLLRWVVYFSHGSPFRGQGTQFITTTSQVSGQHTGTTGAMSADDPGDYKYGVRVVDPASQQALGDDDPRLVVVPGP